MPMWFEAEISVPGQPAAHAAINTDTILYALDDGDGGTLVVFRGGPSANVRTPWDDFCARVALRPGMRPGA